MNKAVIIIFLSVLIAVSHVSLYATDEKAEGPVLRSVPQIAVHGRRSRLPKSFTDICPIFIGMKQLRIKDKNKEKWLGS